MKTRKRAREEAEENAKRNAIFLDLNDHLWEMIICRTNADTYAKLTRACRRFGEFWKNPQIQARILERFTVHHSNCEWDRYGARFVLLHACVVPHMYCINGKLHREHDLPAIIEEHGTKRWYRYGTQHRDGDFPAVEYPEGGKEWWKHGIICRKTNASPLLISDEVLVWYLAGRPEGYGMASYLNVTFNVWWENNKLHRDNDLPAIEASNGTKAWYQKGFLHRDNDQHAVEYVGGRLEWWVDGHFIKKNY